MGLRREELIDGVEIGGVATFLDAAGNRRRRCSSDRGRARLWARKRAMIVCAVRAAHLATRRCDCYEALQPRLHEPPACALELEKSPRPRSVGVRRGSYVAPRQSIAFPAFLPARRLPRRPRNRRRRCRRGRTRPKRADWPPARCACRSDTSLRRRHFSSALSRPATARLRRQNRDWLQPGVGIRKRNIDGALASTIVATPVDANSSGARTSTKRLWPGFSARSCGTSSAVR